MAGCAPGRLLLVLREVRGAGPTAEQFVPGPAITFGFVLLVASLGEFVAYINHMAQSIRPESVIESVARETGALIATREDLRISVRPRIGDYVPGDAAVAVIDRSAAGEPRSAKDRDRLTDSVRASIGIGRDRTMQQDIAFGIRQLVDIGVRALSPGVNDPTTAVQVVDRLHGLLRALGSRSLPTSRHVDDAGVVRVEVDAAQWDDYLHLALDELRQYGGGSMQVLRRLRAALDDLALTVPETRRASLVEHLLLVQAAVERSFPDVVDRENAGRSDVQGIGSGSFVSGRS